MIDEGRLFGRGVAFPPRVSSDGRLEWSAGPQNIRESIRIILLTEPGERVMLQEFGGGLGRFLFLPNIVSTHRQIEDAITQTLGRWEARIQVNAVNVAAADDDERAAVATIHYTLISSRVEDQLRLRLQLSAGA
jgi:phage baseplate assembly protein W